MVISGHLIKMAVTPFDPPNPKTPYFTLHANLMALFFRTGVIADRSFTLLSIYFVCVALTLTR